MLDACFMNIIDASAVAFSRDDWIMPVREIVELLKGVPFIGKASECIAAPLSEPLFDW